MGMFRPEIEAMRGYVPGEQPQAGKFIKLNTNENPYPCSPKVRQAIGRVCQGGLERYPDPAATAFRLRAAELLGVEPDWILCGNGSDDILTIVTRACVAPGQLVRYPTPSYVLYGTLAEIQGARCQTVNFGRNWSLGEDFSAPAEGLRLAYLANPNSPSGTAIPPERVLELAERLPCPMLVDEAYADFAQANCIPLVRQSERILVSRSLSKSYALAGLRFGYVVAQPPVIEQLMKVKDSYNCDALAIAGSTAAIDDQAWLQENRAKVIATRARLDERLRELGFESPVSQANFVWAVHPRVEVYPLYERLKEEHVLVRYMNYPGTGDGRRISVGTDDQVDACLDLLKTMV
jgi:histidinol-phosphate aminotransferase